MNNIDVNKWYVLKVRPRHEKAIADRLSKKYDVFLPLLKNKKQWSDRIKVIETPLFPGYLFIHTPISMKHFILEEPGIGHFVQFGAVPATIREQEIESIKILLEHSRTLSVSDAFNFKQGEEVRVVQGVFNGVVGRVNMLKNKFRLFVLIEQLGKTISVEVDKNSLEKVKN